jgi:hypothetical protein
LRRGREGGEVLRFNFPEFDPEENPEFILGLVTIDGFIK